MVRLRDAGYCNLKLLLIYLVVYGHWIEEWIWEVPILMRQYRWIYAVHMPLFAFLSGLFLTKAEHCRRQCGRTISLYLFLQTAAVFLGHGTVMPKTPYWHLWYLLSCAAWTGFAWLWLRLCKGKGGLLILTLAVMAGCAAGCFPEIDREHSLSRTLVFFPYFWAGLLCSPEFPFRKLLPVGLAAICCAIMLMERFGSAIPTIFFYHAAPFGRLENGVSLRLLCYCIGGLLCLFLLSAVPNRRFPFTRAGADTLPVYLIHPPLILVLRQWVLPWYSYPLLTAALLYLIYKIRQWNSAAFGIVPKERRGDIGRVHANIRGIRHAGVPLSFSPHRR